MVFKKLGLIAALAGAIGFASAVPALAQHHDHGGGVEHGGGDYHGGGEHRGGAEYRGGGWRDHDMHRFGAYDLGHWRGGRWFHGAYGGRGGWWWIVGGVYYSYPSPIYPYPSPYVPAGYGATPNTWYFCPPTQTYYPYAPSCPVPWQPVAAQ